MGRMSTLAAVGGVALGCALLVAPAMVDAHEVRSIADGTYQIVVGFMDEPAFAGEKNGLEFWVSDISAATPTADGEVEGAPVGGLEETLKAEVIYEDQTMELELSPRWNEEGAYESPFFPMKPGDYTFRIYGTIDGTDIDESFTSSPEGFGSVEDPAPLHFPK